MCENTSTALSFMQRALWISIHRVIGSVNTPSTAVPMHISILVAGIIIIICSGEYAIIVKIRLQEHVLPRITNVISNSRIHWQWYQLTHEYTHEHIRTSTTKQRLNYLLAMRLKCNCISRDCIRNGGKPLLVHDIIEFFFCLLFFLSTCFCTCHYWNWQMHVESISLICTQHARLFSPFHIKCLLHT